MPIIMRNDVNPDLIPFQTSYSELIEQQRLRQQAEAERQFARQQADFQAAASKLRADRQMLGAKQPKQESTYAGFNWQQPIQIHQGQDEQGRNLTSTVYQNLGADPLAAQAGVQGAGPGFGVLGTAENHVLDANRFINPNDPFDRNVLADVLKNTQRSRTSIIDARMFKNPFEKRDLDRAEAIAFEQYRHDLQRNADLEKQAQHAKLEGEKFERTQQQKNLEDQEKLSSEISGYKQGIEAQRNDAFNTNDENDFHYTPAQQRQRAGLFEAYDKLERTPVASEKEQRDKARALQRITDELKAIKPREPVKRQFRQETDEKTGMIWQIDDVTGQKTLLFKPEPIKPEKPAISPTERLKLFETARDELRENARRSNLPPPTLEQIQSYVRQLEGFITGQPGASQQNSQGQQPPAAPQQQRAAQVVASVDLEQVPSENVAQIQQMIRDAKARGVPQGELYEQMAALIANPPNAPSSPQPAPQSATGAAPAQRRPDPWGNSAGVATIMFKAEDEARRLGLPPQQQKEYVLRAVQGIRNGTHTVSPTMPIDPRAQSVLNGGKTVDDLINFYGG